ncbi:hypothetical protein GCM10009836_04380 [Pseudonocardia ailaonensis]|uniref:AbiEi antitoxin N-terminal domain-containing protein n=1 Tax=Pseudonocardia ailaonensis TaxID=367279 RepID=A0ABN2MJJ8_9PSEU
MGTAPLSRAGLRAAGWDGKEVRRLQAAGELTRVRRGYYLLGRDARLRDPLGRHRAAIEAALAGLDEGTVVSHVSAAVVHGLALGRVKVGPVQVTRATRTGGRRTTALHLHTAPLPDDDVVVRHGLPVTSVARTVVDLARSLPFEQALVAADGSLFAAETTVEALAAAAGRAVGWPGAPAARRVLAEADGRSESPGETLSRLALVAAGLRPPELQWPVRTRVGLVRTDFAWPERGVVAEFDGRVKYGRLLRPGQDPGDAVFEEKVREDALRDEGLRVVRWIWRDLADFAPTAARLTRALTR